MTKPTISLKNLLVANKTAEVDFPGFDGFKVTLSFLSRDTLIALRKKSTKQNFKGRQLSEEFDDELFLKLYVESGIKGWKGLKLKYVEQLAPVEFPGFTGDEEVEFSVEEALSLMKNSNTFDQWVSDRVTDLSNFQSSKDPK